MNCKMALVREIAPHKRLKRCETHGIAVVEDGSSGMSHSAHPNIDSTGSVSGMKWYGYWGKTDLTVRCHGFIYNASSVIVTDELDRIADQECQCGGHRLLRSVKPTVSE